MFNQLVQCCLVYSFIIQNFYDTLRQNVIDLMQGIFVCHDNWDDDKFEIALKIVVSTVGPPPKGYISRGVMGAEQELIENLIIEGSRLNIY